MQIISLAKQHILTVSIALLLFLQSSAIAGDGAPWTKVIAEDRSSYALKILFIGNSILYVGETPETFAAMIKASEPNKQLKITEVAGSSFSLSDHAAAGMASDVIKSGGPWDYVIVQPQSSEFDREDTKATVAALKRFVDEAKAVRATPLLYEWYGADTIEEYKEDRARVLATCKQLGIDMIPMQTTMAYLQQKNPQIKLRSDQTHLNDTGVFAAVCVLYAKLIGKNPSGISSSFSRGEKDQLSVMQVDANAIKDIAWRVCQIPTK